MLALQDWTVSYRQSTACSVLGYYLGTTVVFGDIANGCLASGLVQGSGCLAGVVSTLVACQPQCDSRLFLPSFAVLRSATLYGPSCIVPLRQ